ncbi:GAF domain-containing sensor histidine kinase [Mucilaginibacter sp. HMF5004]|uniref:GAF domain-containing sensor histidine kinase n=1 Tax=Mucilaginibacter rivuli TaxID=2857527 RepID=UPI001C5D2168|nr:GAF domain-containing sensor histidine kinase [Mucilaginibacter rivuli]MBW4891327.1 GAF domain-containing sensor histidine kinase [Mucilaginibacter rivuli]
MIAPIFPANEDKRLQDVYRSQLLDTPEETEFDEIVQLASDLCNTPISLITILDTERQWFKAKVGLDATETTREVSFCGHAILQDELFEIPDALKDIRFSDNPLVTGGPEIRFYAGMPLVTESGSRLGTLCVIDSAPRVLTERQRFALKVLAGNVIKVAELRMKNKQLHHFTETQKRIISIVAHDVRNPLASIKSVINFKQDDTIDEQTASEMLDMISTQLDSTIEMVDNVVNWGQLQLSSAAYAADEINLKALVDDILTADALGAKMKNNELLNRVDNDVTVGIDKQVIKFILRNLVSNSNKFTENGTITIAAVKQDTATQITIADTGVGMSQETLSRLFTQTTQATTSLGTQNEKGSGLGLMLVKEFIDQINATIRVESKLGEGSKFIIIINNNR